MIGLAFLVALQVGQWTTIPPLNVPRQEVVFGGDAGDRSVTDTSVYDPSADQWTELRPMPTPRNHMGAAVLRGRIYVVGGRPGNLPVNEMYDPATNTWTTKPPMPTARSGHAVGAYRQSLIAIGGEGNP